MKKAWVIQRKNDGTRFAGRLAKGDRYTRLLCQATVFATRQEARYDIGGSSWVKPTEVVRRVELSEDGRPKRIIKGR